MLSRNFHEQTRVLRPCALAAAWLLSAGAAWAQDDASQANKLASSGRPSVLVEPRFGVMQTWTDNNRLSSTNKDAALLTTLTPGISISTTRGAIRGSLDYSLNGIVYTKSDEKARVQHSLAAKGVAELIDNLFFVDASASVSQQAASAFGVQTVDPSLANANRRETATVSVSPRIQGRIGSVANFELRANTSATNVSDAVIGDSHANGGNLRISRAGRAALTWSLDASTQKSSFKTGAQNRVSSATASLGYTPDVDWKLGVLAGRERSDLKDFVLRNSWTYGANLSWTPSPRTKVSADFQSHEYGDSFSYNLEHRWSRSALRFSDSQSVNAASFQNAGAPRSNYDLYFFQFASLVPDPAQRDVFVRNFLRAQGLSADALASSAVVDTGPTVLRTQLLSYSLQGVRTTLTATASRNNNRRLASASSSAGDFAANGRVLQRSLSVNISHNLTPTSSAVLTALQQESEGDTAAQSSTLRSISASWNCRLGTRTNFTLGARAAHSGGLISYRENAMFANLVQQF
ncbi:MAG: TIGR03016 family PEP-CTERM system-associated outer membrane protein [Paucibacter sp.]|nr:TIGR03016 family PEP-CTERM system-associated outer membrane protein [Roseateles sp.]